MKQAKVVMLGSKDESTNIVYNALKDEFNIDKVIIEEPVPKKVFIKRRIKKLGIKKVAEQILFKIFIYPLLRKTSNFRIKEIVKKNKLCIKEICKSKVVNVNSVNSSQTISLLRDINPKIVLVNGTRIISKEVLEATPATFVNMHAGITPMYRGVHGAYWALIEQDAKNCGVTVHLVDKGIDTGGVLEQDIITISKKDNFSTYPFLQLAKGIPLLRKSIMSLINENVNLKDPPQGKSQLRTHPTFFEYLYFRLSRGVK